MRNSPCYIESLEFNGPESGGWVPEGFSWPIKPGEFVRSVTLRVRPFATAPIDNSATTFRLGVFASDGPADAPIADQYGMARKLMRGRGRLVDFDFPSISTVVLSDAIDDVLDDVYTIVIPLNYLCDNSENLLTVFNNPGDAGMSYAVLGIAEIVESFNLDPRSPA